jgi:hypothetical protein
MKITYDKPTKGKLVDNYTQADIKAEFADIYKVLQTQSKLDGLQAKLNLKHKSDMEKIVKYVTQLFAIVSGVLVFSVISLGIMIYLK